MNYFEPHLTPDELRAISAIGLAHMHRDLDDLAARFADLKLV